MFIKLDFYVNCEDVSTCSIAAAVVESKNKVEYTLINLIVISKCTHYVWSYDYSLFTESLSFINIKYIWLLLQLQEL